LYTFFFQAEDGIRQRNVTGVQTCALPISEVEAHVTGDTKSLSLMVEGVRYFSILKQCLGWDTTHVQAHTAPVLLFYNCNLLAQQIGRASCREREAMKSVWLAANRHQKVKE